MTATRSLLGAVKSDLLLQRAAFLCTAERYDRNSREAAIEPFAKQFHLSALLERANLRDRSGSIPRYGGHALVREAKDRLCRHLGVPHISVWEQQVQPDWQKAKAALEASLG